MPNAIKYPEFLELGAGLSMLGEKNVCVHVCESIKPIVGIKCVKDDGSA